MKRQTVSLLALGTALIGCSPELDQSSTQVGSSSISQASSDELFEVFANTCVKTFPDFGRTKAAMNREGLKTIEYVARNRAGESPGGLFKDSQRGINAMFGEIIYELSEDYDGSPIPTEICEVSAEIADPDADWTPLLNTLSARYLDLNWTPNGNLGLSFNRAGASLVVRVQPHGFEGATLSVELLESLEGWR